MKLKNLIAIYLLLFSINIFSNECTKPPGPENAAQCAQVCKEDIDCKEARICGQFYSINTKYDDVFKNYIKQFQPQSCEPDKNGNVIINGVCYTPKCVSNKCVRLSTTCSKNPIRMQATPNYQTSSLKTFENFIGPHFEKGKTCTVESVLLEKYIFKNKKQIDLPFYKTKVVLEYAQDQLQRKNNNDGVYCSGLYLVKTIEKDTGAGNNFNDQPNLLAEIKNYLIKFITYSPEIAATFNQRNQDYSWQIIQKFSTDLDFLNKLPSELLTSLYALRGNTTWNHSEADFYFNKRINGITLPLFGPGLRIFLEDNPDYYNQKVLPILNKIKPSESAIRNIVSYSDESNLIQTLISKKIANQHQKGIINFLSEKGEEQFKCSFAEQFISYYSAATTQKDYLKLLDSKSNCIKQKAASLKMISRKDPNGCDFALSSTSISQAHFAELKNTANNCKKLCNQKSDCLSVNLDCLNPIAINNSFKDDFLKPNPANKNPICNDIKIIPEVSADCIAGLCEVISNNCTYPSFTESVKKFVNSNDLNLCNVDSECELSNARGNIFPPIMYAFSIKQPNSRVAISSYVSNTQKSCTAISKQFWATERNDELGKRFEPKCIDNKCFAVAY
nr:hypothetical protein BHI3_15540 [Bacteriovorax sp. HI3]